MKRFNLNLSSKISKFEKQFTDLSNKREKYIIDLKEVLEVCNLKTLSEKIVDMNNKIKEIKQCQVDLFNESFKEVIKEVFSSVPGLNKIGWTQYTPYFNDGEECVFGVSDPSFDIKELNDEPEKEEDNSNVWKWASSYRIKDKRPKEQYETIKAFEDLINNNEDALRSVYGDHAKIIITPENIEVTEYEHD